MFSQKRQGKQKQKITLKYCPILRMPVPLDELVNFRFVPSAETPDFVSYAFSESNAGINGGLSGGQLYGNTMRVHTSVANALDDGHLVIIGTHHGGYGWWKRTFLRTFLVNPRYADQPVERGRGKIWDDLHDKEVDIRMNERPHLKRVFYRYVLSLRKNYTASVAARRSLTTLFTMYPRWDPVASGSYMYSKAAEDLLYDCFDQPASHARIMRLLKAGLFSHENSAIRVFENEVVGSAWSFKYRDLAQNASSRGPPREHETEQMLPVPIRIARRMTVGASTWFRDKRNHYERLRPAPNMSVMSVPAKVNHNFSRPAIIDDARLVLEAPSNYSSSGDSPFTGTPQDTEGPFADPPSDRAPPSLRPRLSDSGDRPQRSLSQTSHRSSSQAKEPKKSNNCTPYDLSGTDRQDDDSEPDDAPAAGPSRQLGTAPAVRLAKGSTNGAKTQSKTASQTEHGQNSDSNTRKISLKGQISDPPNVLGRVKSTDVGLKPSVMKPFSFDSDAQGLKSSLSQRPSNVLFKPLSLGSLLCMDPLMPQIPEWETSNNIWCFTMRSPQHQTSTAPPAIPPETTLSSEVPVNIEETLSQDLVFHPTSSHTLEHADQNDQDTIMGLALSTDSSLMGQNYPERGRTRERGNRHIIQERRGTEISDGLRDMIGNSSRLGEMLQSQHTVENWQANIETPSLRLSVDSGEVEGPAADEQQEVAVASSDQDSPFKQYVSLDTEAHSPTQQSSTASPKAGTTRVTTGNAVGSTIATTPDEGFETRRPAFDPDQADRKLDTGLFRRQQFTEDFGEDSIAGGPTQTDFDAYQSSYDAAKGTTVRVRDRNGEIIREAVRGSLLIASPPPSIIDVHDANHKPDVMNALNLHDLAINRDNCRDIGAQALTHVLSTHGVRQIDGYPLWSLSNKPNEYWRLRIAFKNMSLDLDLVRQETYNYLRLQAYGVNPGTQIIRPGFPGAGFVDRKLWAERIWQYGKRRLQAQAEFELVRDSIPVNFNPVLDTTRPGWHGRRRGSLPPKATIIRFPKSKRSNVSCPPPYNRDGPSEEANVRSSTRAPIPDPFLLGREVEPSDQGSHITSSASTPPQSQESRQSESDSSGGGIPMDSDGQTLSSLRSYAHPSSYNRGQQSDPRPLGAFATSPPIEPQSTLHDPPSGTPPISPDAILPFHTPEVPPSSSRHRHNVLSEGQISQMETSSPLQLSQGEGETRMSWHEGDDGAVEQAGPSQRSKLPITQPKFVGKGKGKELPEQEGGDDPFVELSETENVKDSSLEPEEPEEPVVQRKTPIVGQPTRRQMYETMQELEGLSHELQEDDNDRHYKEAEESNEEERKGDTTKKKRKGWRSWWSPSS